MMETVHISETSVYFNETTRRYIPEGCHLHTLLRHNVVRDFKINRKVTGCIDYLVSETGYTEVFMFSTSP
jgi:hypothetical protein